MPNFYDLFVNVPDSPGAIHEITELLKDQQISLTNIHILETQTEIYGVLNLSLKNEDDLNLAKEVIAETTDYLARFCEKQKPQTISVICGF